MSVTEQPAEAVEDLSLDLDHLSTRRVTWARRKVGFLRFLRMFSRHKGGMTGFFLLMFFVVVAFLAPIVFPRDMLDLAANVDNPDLASPSWEFPLGTDNHGRSVLALICYGARVSLLVGLTATFMAMVIGTLVGIGSGHYRNWFGSMLLRVTDWFLVIPWLVLAVVVVTVLEGGLLTTVIVIGLTSWAGTARLIRAQTLSIEGRPYLERARVLGTGNWKQMTRHVLPNVMPLVLANGTLTVSIAILTETTLAFLGLGDYTIPSWGKVLEDANEGAAMILGAWWWVLPPGLCVVLVVLSFTLMGRALEAIFDPRLQNELS